MRAIAIGLLFLTLAACTGRQSFRDIPITQEVPIIGIAAVPGVGTLELDGFVQAAPNGNALVRMSGGSIACEGLFDPQGRGRFFCSNGLTLTLAIPQEVYRQRNGRGVVGTDRGGRLALGWGQFADTRAVASLLQS